MKLINLAKLEFGIANCSWGLDIIKTIMKEKQVNPRQAIRIYHKDRKFWQDKYYKSLHKNL